MTIPAAKGKNASYEARQKQAQDWPLVLASVNLTMDGDNVSAATDRHLRRGADPLAERRRREGDHRQAVTLETAAAAGEAAAEGAVPLSMNAYKVRPDQDRGQAGLARGRRQPLLGGGLTSLHPMARIRTRRPPRPRAADRPCRHLRNKGMYVYTDGHGRETTRRLRQHHLLVLENHEELRPGRRNGRRSGMPRSVAVVLRTALTLPASRSHQSTFPTTPRERTDVLEAFFFPSAAVHREWSLALFPKPRFTFMRSQGNIKFCQDLS